MIWINRDAKIELAKKRMVYIISTYKTTDDIIQAIVDDNKMFNYDPELFNLYTEQLRRYTDENAQHIGNPEYLQYLDMVIANSTWMDVVLNKDTVNNFAEYRFYNKKYHIHDDIKEV